MVRGRMLMLTLYWVQEDAYSSDYTHVFDTVPSGVIPALSDGRGALDV